MNLFCFTLDGSTESVYEPAYGQTLKDVLPKYQCSSALLSSRTEWGGSSPSITSSSSKPRKENRRSCVATSSSADETFGETVVSTSGRESSRKDRGVCENDLLNDLQTQEVTSQSATRTHQKQPPCQSGESPAAEPVLKRLQNLVQARRGLTCIGLGRREPARAPTSPQEPQQTAGLHPDPEEDRVWSPHTGNFPLWDSFGCKQPWAPLYHSCHLPGHERWACGGTLSLPRTTEWDRFQSLIQELDNKQSPPQMIRSITDLHLSQNKLSRFGRCDAFRHSQDKTDTRKPEAGGEADRSRLDVSVPSDGKDVKASPEKHDKQLNSGDPLEVQLDKMEADGGKMLGKGRRRSSNSLESLYSLKSGQSSSSGVTSGSDCSSNRNSLRLDDDLPSTRQFCGRARVHTEYVPSPYDTESLKLKVGDEIDIIAKPPMGIWRGSLKGKIGSFKFIYVDVLPDESHEENQGVRHRSTVQEVLRRLSLEEYSSSLQLGGYQTVDDLMKLSEPHLMKLNVTDPEHRQRMLAAVRSLQLLHADGQQDDADWDNGENVKPGIINCPRDSGCHMASEGSDAAAEEAELNFSSERIRLANATSC